MAHVAKYAKGATGRLTQHFERKQDEKGEHIKYGNQDIDLSKTHENYNLAPHREQGQVSFIRERCQELNCLNRTDVNVMASWVVTLPKDFSKEQEREFFEQSYKFLENRYGEKNVISAYVHKDEVTPHMHFAFVPAVYDQKKGKEKVSAKECISKKDLVTFHKDLSKHMERYFGHDVGILNEATREGNKSIEELKRQSAKERLHEAKGKANEIVLEASKMVLEAEEEVKDIESSLVPIKAEYEAKKAFIDQCVKDSDVSMMYPNYAEVTKKGLIKKQEYVTVPKEKWEKKHVSANQIEAIKREREVLEKTIKDFQQSEPAKKIADLEKQVQELKQQNISLNQSIKKVNGEIEMVNKVFNKYPEIKEQFYKAEKTIQRNMDRSRGLER